LVTEMPGTAKSKFIELIVQINKAKGLDELHSCMIGILYAEPGEVSLEELAQRTGYSLSAVSTAMKFLERTGLVRRVRKPGSRKVYFFMEKDLIMSFIDAMKKSHEVALLKAKSAVPGIIERYRNRKGPREELRIIENYYRQLITVEGILKEFIARLEDAHIKERKTK
jgi:DNA-binding transcriptional regulator GbsR (MarR family)